MTINITLPEAGPNLHPTITVVGVGGAGGNAVNNMIRSNLEGVDFLIANTDAQALENSTCENRIQLGLKSTKGLGAGMRPDVGRQAAEEAVEELKNKLDASHMVFIAAGMGGGTGTGAAPVIAKLARENGILTVGVITKPFHFEGTKRMQLAESGIEELQQQVDTLITIPNQNLFRIANEKTTFSDAFKMADDILYAGVRGVTDLMVQPGLINLDFSDIKTVMSEMGKAMMGTAQSDSSDNRAIEAAERAIANPLIDDVSLKGAKGLIINITGGSDLTLYEVDEAANRIKQEVQDEANIIYGTTCDERLEGIIRVSIVATGIDNSSSIKHNPIDIPKTLSIDNSVYHQKSTIENNDISASSFVNNTDSEENSSESLSFSEESSENELHNNESNNSNGSENYNLSENIEENSSLNEDSLEEDNLVYTENNDEKSKNINFNQENDNINEKNNENQSTVRKLSLFDTLNEDSVNNENERKEVENIQKSEPILSSNEVSENTENNEKEINESSEEFEPEEESTSYEDLNQDQEEELLDIPTFLRRQAN
tara:strand:+ start:1462 stop:3093 length:1632 start_codon:yes stop_codon:yes gene_type:complete